MGVNTLPVHDVYDFETKTHDTLLIIPVWNEGLRIQNQLIKLSRIPRDFDIFIVDGDSNDGSVADFKFLINSGVRKLIIRKEPGGLSAQLRLAFFYGTSEQYKYIITMDGNDKDDSRGIVEIQTLLRKGYDFVQGSRFVVGGKAINTPWSRLLAIKTIHAPLTSLFAGFRFSDTTNGFRGFRRDVLTDSRIQIHRTIFREYELIAYLPIRISRLNYRVAEVPVTRAYPKGEKIPTKINGMGSKLKLIRTLINSGIGRYNPS